LLWGYKCNLELSARAPELLHLHSELLTCQMLQYYTVACKVSRYLCAMQRTCFIELSSCSCINGQLRKKDDAAKDEEGGGMPDRAASVLRFKASCFAG
jgi:hypothetical protein